MARSKLLRNSLVFCMLCASMLLSFFAYATSVPIYSFTPKGHVYSPIQLHSLWVITHKIEISVFVFVFIVFILASTYLSHHRFKKRVFANFVQLMQPGAEPPLPIQLPTGKIIVISFLLVIGCIVGFILLITTYQSYDNQLLVQAMALALFGLTMIGCFFIGGITRSKQLEKLINRLQIESRSNMLAQQKLLEADRRLQSQNACLSRLASIQLKYAASPKDFFEQLVMESAIALDVGRVGIWVLSENKQLLNCEASYNLATNQISSGQELQTEHLPQYFAALSQARVIAINDAMNHPATVEFAKDYLPSQHIGAMLDATIWHNDEMTGVLCHEHIGGYREWTMDEQSFVGSLADLTRLALETHRLQMVQSDLQHKQTQLNKVQKHIDSIERNAKLFRFLVERAPVTILYMNTANEIMEMNPEAEQLSGYSREYAIGRTYQELFATEQNKKQLQSISEDVMHGRKVQGQEVAIRCADGSIVELSVSRSMELDDEGNPVIISIGQDMSKQKALEASLIKAREAAESADRIKSMFVASMSHELRTPLNSIIGFLGVVLQGMSGELNVKQKDQLGRAYNSSKHLLSLITDVIDISKIEAGFLQVHVEKFDLAALLVEVQHATQHLVQEKKLYLSLDCPANLNLETDRKRLYQVILNVVSNALKYSEDGGVKLHASIKAKQLEIKVQDTGIGIGEADLAKLFKPFERIESHLKIKTLGTGLGLYLTRKILAQLLGGKISVTSKLAEGSTFTISIPTKISTAVAQSHASILEDAAP